MKRKKITNFLFVVIIVILSGFLISKNYSSENFWTASFIQILTLIVTSGLSFFFVQKLTDKRRKIDCYEHILNEVQNIVENNTKIFSVEKEALLLQKSIANKIKYLKEHSFSEIKSDLEYIENQFQELRDLYGNHSTNIYELKNIELDMLKHKTNIFKLLLSMFIINFNNTSIKFNYPNFFLFFILFTIINYNNSRKSETCSRLLLS